MKISDIFFRRKHKAETTTEDRSEWSDFWFKSIYALAQSGVSVTPENALRVTVVFACDKVISETIASLSFLTYKRLSNGGKERAPEHPLYYLLHNSPNNIQTAFEYIASMQHYVNLYGNAYSPIIRNPYGKIIALDIPIHPIDVVVDLVKENGQKYLRYTNKKTGEIFVGDEIWHWKENCHNGLTGVSPIGEGTEAVGLAVATEKYGSSFFANSYRPSGSIEYPVPLTKEQGENLRTSLKRQAEHGIFVLDNGAKFNKLQQTAEEAQYLLTRQHQVEEICRLYDMPLHRVQHLLRSTFSNVESQEQTFYSSCILKRLKNIEQSAAKNLFLDENYYAEFLMESLLRADTATRTEAYVKLVNNGLRTRNEIRILDNLNPYEGGDKMLIQQNLAMIDEKGNITPVNNNQPKVADPVNEEEVNEFVNTSKKLNEEKSEALNKVLTGKKENTIIENMVQDASKRIANAEIREIEKIGENEEKKKGFYAKHFEYINKTLMPFGIKIKPETLTLKKCEDKDYLEDHIYCTIMGVINAN